MKKVNDIQATSLEALGTVDLARSRREVLNAIAAFPGPDCTNHELAKFLGWEVNRVTPRVFELRKKLQIEMTEKRPDKYTGRTSMAWRIKPLPSANKLPGMMI